MQDIRSTGEEAERWIESLGSDHLPLPTDTQPVKPISHSKETATAFAQNQAHPVLVLLIFVILLSPLILIALYQSGRGRSSTTSPSITLGYSASCGSASSSSGRWWPVLGGGNRSLLLTVQRRYCGDAYINKRGALQVASFGSWEEADSFRARMEEATGESFRVGQESLPGE